MENNIIPEPTLYVPYTKEDFESKLAALNAGSMAYWNGGASNYCYPLIDVDNTYWMIILSEYTSAFTTIEKSLAKEITEIVLPQLD